MASCAEMAELIERNVFAVLATRASLDVGPRASISDILVYITGRFFFDIV